MRFPKTLLAATAGAGITVIPSFAQDLRTSPVVTTPRTTPVPAQTLMLSDLLNWEVFLQTDQPAGTITDFVIGPQGNVLFAIGTLNGQNYPIPFSGMTINANDQFVQLAATQQQFERMPFFTGRNFPDFNSPALRRSLTQVFGDRIMDTGLPRGRGNLGANQTEGRDTLNPAGKAPPGLNRDRVPSRNDQNRDLNDPNLDDLPADRNRDPRNLPRGTGTGTGTNGSDTNTDLPGTQKPTDRTTPGANRVPPRTPGSSALPSRPSGTPNTPIPRPGATTPGATPPAKPPVTPPSTPAPGK